MMTVQRAVLVLLMLLSSTAMTFAQEETKMPFILFKDIIRKTDKPDTKYLHPILKNARMPVIFASVQEGNLLRVAKYGKTLSNLGNEWGRYHFINKTGKDLTGLPAGYLNPDDDNLFFGENGEYELVPYAPANSKKIGTSEWPNEMTWKHVWKNYYIITVYKGVHVVTEHLTVERDGKDVYPILGESNEHPPPNSPGFTASDLGYRVFITPNGRRESYSMLLLDNESPLPPDFPKDLIKWIP